jgi:hypothetical protein
MLPQSAVSAGSLRIFIRQHARSSVGTATTPSVARRNTIARRTAGLSSIASNGWNSSSHWPRATDSPANCRQLARSWQRVSKTFSATIARRHIYDPAVYFGDRETDLAMTRLFGGFGHAFYAAYNETWPLPDGHERRTTLYQLYHVLNHLNLFGVSYLAKAMNQINQLLL